MTTDSPTSQLFHFLLFAALLVAIPIAVRLLAGVARARHDEDASVFDHPAAFRAAAYRNARRRALWSPDGLVRTALPSALLAGLGAYSTRNMPTTAQLYITGFGAVMGCLLGRNWTRAYADRIATEQANAALTDALTAYWEEERAPAEDWAATRGLRPVADPDFSEAADATATLSDCLQQAFGPVLQGDLNGRRTTVFGVVQYGAYGYRSGDGERSSNGIRSFTGVHVERRGAPVSLLVHPRKSPSPRCGLDELDLELYGDEWRPQARLAETDERGFVSAETRDGRGDPTVLEAQMQAMHAQAAPWASTNGHGADAPHGLDDLWRMARGPRWRDLETESVAFDERYRVQVQGDDPTRAVRILEPSLIVALTDVQGAEAWYELGGDNLVVLAPGRALEPETLDRLLAAAQAFVEHVERTLV